MAVDALHPEYTKHLKRWQLTQDCAEGAAAVKSRRGGIEYLPKPMASDTSAENTARYEAYKKRANFVNFTGKTKKGMIGLAFRKPPTLDLNSQIEYIKENANGAGLSLEQMIRATLGATLENGRYGLLVDYPSAESGLTKAQVESRKLRASILPYKAETVLNWRTTVIDGVEVLSLVVLLEKAEKIADDGFGVETVDNYRVLKLNEKGTYYQQLYNDDKVLTKTFEPRGNDGALLKEIPFIFIGSENNDPCVDDAPLYDLAEVNLSHYRNSADYEESCYMVGQPTPVISGLSQSWVSENMENGIILGSRSAILLPDGGSATLLQAEPNQMPLEGMGNKEKQMINIGAQIIQDNQSKGNNETAEGARIRNSGQNSDLAAIIGNIENGFKKCFEWLHVYMGGESKAELEINREFYDRTLDAQQVMALIQLADRGDISQTDIRSSLRRAGWLATDKTDDEIDSEAQSGNFGLMQSNEAPTQTTDPQLVAILTAISEKIGGKSEYLPAGNNQDPIQVNVEAPIVNVTLPENMIAVQVDAPAITVEQPAINVEAPQITVEGNPITINESDGKKKISIQRDNDGEITGASVDG